MDELDDIDGLLVGAEPCIASYDVCDYIDAERCARGLLDESYLRSAEDWSILGSKVVGAEGPL